MSEHKTSEADENDEMLVEMVRLAEDTRRVKRAHFIAAQYKRRNQRIIGVLVIVLNVLIGSGLLEAYAQSKAAIIIKTLSFLAASLAGVQTFFNFQKEVECHTASGDIYSSINRRLRIQMAEYRSKPRKREEVLEEFKALSAEYIKANDDSRACIPSDGDLSKADAEIKKQKKSRNRD